MRRPHTASSSRYANSGFGYKRDDPSTHRTDCLPVINEKGMIMSYGVSQEDWVWKVRTEPGVVGAFEKWVSESVGWRKGDGFRL